MAARVELTGQAAKDLEDLGSDRTRVMKLIDALGSEPRPANLDVRPLRGRASWSRARVGSYHVIFRPLTSAEMAELGAAGTRGSLVARIVHRRDLDRVIRSL